MKNIDVGFVNYKTPKLTKICLKYLKENVLNQVNKIFVVDNNSQDKSLEPLLLEVFSTRRSKIPHWPTVFGVVQRCLKALKSL